MAVYPMHTVWRGNEGWPFKRTFLLTLDSRMNSRRELEMERMKSLKFLVEHLM